MTLVIPNWQLKKFTGAISKLNKKGVKVNYRSIKEEGFVFGDNTYMGTVFEVEDFEGIDSLVKYSVDGIEQLPPYALSYLGYDTKMIIALAFYFIGKFGFVSSKEEDSTKSKVLNGYFDPKLIDPALSAMESDSYREFRSWLFDRKIEGEFEYQAKKAVDSDYCKIFAIGYICAYVNKFIKEKEREKFLSKTVENRNLEDTDVCYNPDYLGRIGDSVDFECIKSSIVYTNPPYAYNSPVTFVNKLIDKDGHVIIWTTSQQIPDHCLIKATVKAHKVYKGINETVITRGKIHAC